MAAKRGAPHASLGWLVAAAQLPDLVWPVLVLAGIERVQIVPGATAYTPLDFEHYPWSHSLAMIVAWGLAFGALFYALRRNGRGAAMLALLVVSHWALDWIVHRPDLPLAPGLTRLAGLGLWSSVAGTLLVEAALLAVGLALYLRLTSARDGAGRWGFASWIAFLVAIQLATAFGPPPPSVSAVAMSALAVWLLVAWAGWADRHRSLNATPAS
jgi:hypothetical protein